MTRLEEEILAAIDAVPMIDNRSYGLPNLCDDYNGYAKAAAEVAKKYIKKAWSDSFANTAEGYNQEIADYAWFDDEHESFILRRNQWLKENGITE